jgi:hypothetical protein
MLVNSVRAVTLGPLVSMAQYVRSPLGLLMHLRENISVELCAVALLGSASFTWKLSQYMRGNQLAEGPPHKASGKRLLHWERCGLLSEWGKIMVLGITMLILAYPLALTTSPLATSGRGTRVHTAAAVGAAVVFGALSSACLSVAKMYGRERIFTLGIGTGLALLACGSVSVQSDYSLSWSLQREFWTRFVRLSPSVSDGSVFLLDPPKDTTQISSFSWSTILVLESIYQFPEVWQSPDAAVEPLHNAGVPGPRVLVLREVSRARYCAGQDLFESSGWPSFAAEYSSCPPKVRLIKSSDNGLSLDDSPCAGAPIDRSRATGSIKITELARRPMYRYLIR